MTEHSHEWFAGLLPGYALGAADADERQALEQHLAHCADCRELAADYRAVGEDLLYAVPLAAAPVGLTERLRVRLNAEGENRAARPKWLSFLRSPVFSLGLVALALLVFTNVYWVTRVSRLERTANEVAKVTQAQGISLQVADGMPHADGVVYVQPGSRVGLLCVYALPELEQGQTYQAWLVRENQRVSAGTFDVNADGYGVLLLDPGQPISGYQQLGITIEPAGGSPAPTTPRIMGGAL